jgi:hypothetical protein
MATLIYKRTHNGDPDPDRGVFGYHDCMGRVRGWIYNAVIGVGGIGQEPIAEGIAGRLTWIGIGPHRTGDLRKPTVTFDHFWYKGPQGPMLESVAPALARRMYAGKVRVIKDSALAPAELADVENILRCARLSPPSPSRGREQQTASRKSGRPCRSRAKVC